MGSTLKTCGNYALVERIAKGGMAEVYLGRTTGAFGVDRLVAVKMLLPMRAESKQIVAMFIDEARLAVELTHVNIVQIFELGVSEGRYYIAMEYVPGSDLAEILRRVRSDGERMAIAPAVYIAYCVCAALDYAHTRCDADGEPLNIVHRDVSPQNVLIGDEGGVKVADFGIALSNMRLTQTVGRKLKGKVCYMSPEQAWGRQLDPRSDIFSVGTLLYEMLTGVVPFDGNTELDVVYEVRECQVRPPRQLRPEIPEELEAIVMRALTQDPEQRYASAEQMHAALEPLLLIDDRPFGARDLRDFIGGLRVDDAEEKRRHLDEVLAAEETRVEVEAPPADWSDVDVTQIIQMELGESAILAVHQPWAAETGLRDDVASLNEKTRDLPEVLVGDAEEADATEPVVARSRGVTSQMARMPTRDIEEVMREVGTDVLDGHVDEDGTGLELIETTPRRKPPGEARAALAIDGDEWWTVPETRHRLTPGKFEAEPVPPPVAHAGRRTVLSVVGVIAVAMVGAVVVGAVLWMSNEEPRAPADTSPASVVEPRADVEVPAMAPAEPAASVQATRADVIRLRRGLASLLRGRGLTRGDSSQLDEYLARLAVAFDAGDWDLAYEQAEAAMTFASELEVTARMVRGKLARMQRRAEKVDDESIREQLEGAIVEGRALLQEGDLEEANLRLYAGIVEGFAAARAGDATDTTGELDSSPESNDEPEPAAPVDASDTEPDPEAP